MKILFLSVALLFVYAGTLSAQTKSVNGTVVDYWVNNNGTSEMITVKVGSKRYEVFITRPDLRQPRIVGTVNEIGRVVRVYYTSIVRSEDADGELRATRIVEIKKSKK